MSIKVKVALLALLGLIVVYLYAIRAGESQHKVEPTASLEVVESEMPQLEVVGQQHKWNVMAGEPVVFNFSPITLGVRKSLFDYEGQIVVLNFWGSWCQPCITEMPMLQSVADDFADKGVAVVGVAVDQLESARKAVAQLGIKYDNLLGDGEGDVMDVISQYGNTDRHMPFTVIFMRDGALKYSYVGELTREMLDNILNTVLKGEQKVQ